MEWLKMRTSRNAIRLLQNGYRNAIDALYPYRCPVCDTVVDKRGEICRECRYKVKYVTSPFCAVCSKPLEQEDTELCFDCRRKAHEFVRGVAAFAYTKEIKESLYRFKYGNRREYADFYAESLYRLKGHIINSFEPEVLIPVPLHRARLRKRGYNQAELLADGLGRRMGLPVDTNLLLRRVNTLPQKELNDRERAKNIKNAFQVRNCIVKYKKIILVDDIYTTGATVDACAAALKDCGAREIYFAAVCVGRGF